jgi:hypothetical protein
LGKIAGEHLDPLPHRAQQTFSLSQRGLVQVVDHDRGAAFRQFLCNRPAYTAAGTSYQSRFAIKSEGHS